MAQSFGFLAEVCYLCSLILLPEDNLIIMRSKVLISLTLLVLASMAQNGKHFDADKQMSSSFTTQVYLDRDGFIWIATRNGLNKYDGYQFQILKKEQKQNLGMASNYVNCMLQDRQGLFYIGMYGAFQTYDGERFHDVATHDLEGNVTPCYITCLLQRQNGDILVGTSGHGILRMTDNANAYQMGGALEPLQSAHRMLEDSRGRLWIVTDYEGVWCVDGNNVSHFFQDEQERGISRDLCEDKTGTVYLSTSTQGVFRFDGRQFVHVEASGQKHVSTLYVNRSGLIMLGYDGQGLAIYDPKTGQLTDNPYYSRDVDLTTAKVYSITEDLSGNVWLGLLQKGIYMQPVRETGFQYMGYKLGTRNVIGTACVTSVLRSRGGYTWVGTDKDGLYCLSAEDRLVKHFKQHFPATILGLCEDRQGRVWTGSYREGLGWIDTATLTYHAQPLPQGADVSVFDLETDQRGRLWLATMGDGLLRMDLSNGEVKAYTMADNAANDRRVNSIANNYISQLSLSPDGKRVYTATTMGVCAMDIDTENWLSTFKGQNCPNYGTPVRIAREFGDKLRVGTNDGLFCYDLKKHQIERHDMVIGLADNGISSIEQDQKGNLWIATDHGLCCMDVKTQKTTSYYVDNGLQSNEFSDGASFCAPDGSLLFGGLGGITWFRPEDLQQTKWTAEVKLTNLKVNGQNVTAATRSGWWQVTASTVIASDHFDLSSSDNSFALQFSTLTYDNPEHIVYRYRINDEAWVRLQPGVNEITFSHMSPGSYRFCVVAERNNQSTPERCFTIVIHAPWYRTPLAYIVYVLALVGLFLWYRYQRHRKEQDHLRLQEHIHAEEMADARLQFFMNISHEIRTPMTLIVTPLQSLIKQDDDPHRRSIYATIRRNAERILGLINQMMDLRKIDKGLMQMHMRETELIAFIDDLYTLFAQQARAKSIRFSFDHDTPPLPVWIDRAHFDKVIVNILSNAFKYTPAGGDIRISVTRQEPTPQDTLGTARIAVFNSGENIPEDRLEHIFKRFYQIPSTVNDRHVGTGIGLDLTRSLVELHHGTITAHNVKGGCEFVVTIPLGHQHLKPEEIITEQQEAQHNDNENDNENHNEVENRESNIENAVALPKAGRRQRIVVVEDDAEIRDYLRGELSADYDVTTAADGRSGLSEVMHIVPDLVISDIMMPEMDGNMLCSKVKANPATSHVPVILLTAKSSDEDQLQGLEMGADAYVMKPFNMDILRHTIVNLVHTHQLLQLKYGRNDLLEEQVDDVKMKSPDDQLLERVMKVINKHIGNSDLSVDLVASEVGISRVHLHRKMKELTGQTPHDFIRNIRLKQAANLLSTRNMNITEVIYACGFNNAASFSTIFKKFYGMSPREYMNEHKTQQQE